MIVLNIHSSSIWQVPTGGVKAPNLDLKPVRGAPTSAATQQHLNELNAAAPKAPIPANAATFDARLQIEKDPATASGWQAGFEAYLKAAWSEEAKNAQERLA